MDFDIHQLDSVEWGDEEAEKALDVYQGALLEQFIASPEGQARLQEDPEMGFWAGQFIYFGYAYLGATLPRMTPADAEEIVTDLFPRKVSIQSPDEADDVVPELIAFWEFLKRAYRLRRSGAILRYLHEVEPGFREVMNDPSRFGMAKSFFTMGQQAGFDMTDEREMDAFMHAYNAGIISQDPDLAASLGLPGLFPGHASSPGQPSPRAQSKKKKSRKKMAKASRRKNRKKRK